MASPRTSRLAGIALVSLLLAGCMRIYPDSELPDLEVTWFADDCGDNTGQVVVTLAGIDDSSRAEVTAACDAPEVTFKDVKRQRYRIDATLFDQAGEIVSASASEADLRDGIDERVELYFSSGTPFRVGWTFDMGASCASLSADTIVIELVPGTQLGVPCEANPWFGFEDNGTYTMRLRALSAAQTVAISPESAPFVLFPPFVDLGIVTLSPCAPACPEP